MPSLSSFSKTLLVGALLAGGLAFAGLVFLRPSLTGTTLNAPAASGLTTVFLSQPTPGQVGEAMVVKLVANNAKGLAGFQATLTFDPNLIHLTDAKLSHELSRTGRGLLALGPVIGYDTATLGAATCPVLVCHNLAEARLAQRQTQGVSGRVELAEFEVFIVAPGAHTLTLSEVQLVASDGAVLEAVTTSALTLTTH